MRQNNEDTFLCLNFDSREVRYLGKVGEATLDHGDFVFAVSDGMGGAKSGEFASKIAAEKITRLLPQSFKQSAQNISAGHGDVLTELFHRIHQELIKLGRHYEECRGMGATLSLGWFTPGWMHFAHVGDSRIYWLPKSGPMKQLTDDHTYVGWLRRKGELNERQARTHPRKSVLMQVLGAGRQSLDPQIGSVSCESGDHFLFCTDGVIDGIWDHRLADMLAKDDAKTIVEYAVSESGRDNASAVVVEML
ncbi:protein phosphatase 2C domain-containing protein [Prosthecobacter sp.]|uniref:PP2C family protein-serine/threonine phosphatase n=1 Tax=Prosthecobacter sp. TaxID=1965333 RepID=UPI0025E7D828|nr:protein phosphatase 2C domain-containing protein [Prosthecobacter sp.]